MICCISYLGDEEWKKVQFDWALCDMIDQKHIYVTGAAFHLDNI